MPALAADHVKHVLSIMHRARTSPPSGAGSPVLDQRFQDMPFPLRTASPACDRDGRRNDLMCTSAVRAICRFSAGIAMWLNARSKSDVIGQGMQLLDIEQTRAPAYFSTQRY